MVHGIILTDNLFLEQTEWIARGSGAHRIATWLRDHGYRIEVVDYCMRWSLEEWRQLLDRLVGPETLFLGIGANLFHSEGSINLLLQEFRDRYPQTSIVVGGNNLINRKMAPVDYLVEGYAEVAMLELLDVLQGKKHKENLKFSDKSGLTPVIDAIHDYPFLDTQDLRIKYLPSDFILEKESVGIETARGCVFKCAFCTYPLIGKKKLEYMRDPKTIYQEMLDNFNTWGTTTYIINEDTFNDRIEKLENLAALVEKLPFQPAMVAYMRLDLILARPQTIPLLKKIGLRGVHFGIETFTRESGLVIGKGKDPEQLKQGLLWFKSQMPETNVTCTMILGLPYDDPAKHYQYQEWFQSSGLDYWSWAPLYMTNLEQTIHTSQFSRRYKDYGMALMTEKEINDEINKLEFEKALLHYQGISTDQKSYQWYLNEDFRSKVIYWKNDSNQTNYISMSEMSNDLNRRSTNRKLSPWAMFNYRGLGYEFDEMMHWTYHSRPRYPQEEIIRRSENIVNQYKQNKITFDYSTLYQ